MIVDVHAHCYPKPYVEELKNIGAGDEGGIATKIPVWVDADERISLMDELGIDVQVLNLSAPNVYFQDSDLSMALAQMTNDFFAEICRKHPDRFLCLASVPLNNMKYALDELDRVIHVLGMDGVLVGTNINGEPISNDRFLPFFEEVNKRRIPIGLHPIKAIGEDLMPPEYLQLAMAPSVGFIFETTRTMAQMTYKGIFERYPDLVFILPHSGGAIPFLYPRWDITYLSRPEGHPLRRLPNFPSYYLKRHYYDTALSYYHSSLRCTIDFVGTDHMLFGTDFPYSNDFRARDTIQHMETYGFTSKEKDKIYFKNAAALFPKLKNERLYGNHM